MNGESRIQCIVIGAGGQASVVIDALLASNQPVNLTIVDADPQVKQVLDFEVAGTDAMIPELIEKGFEYFVIGVGSVGDSSVRRRIASEAERLGLKPLSVVHPAATVSPYARLGAGVQVLAGAVVNPGAVVGDYAIINTSAVVEHDCQVGAFAHVAPRAALAGDVRVADDAHVGIGATVREGVHVGSKVLVGAGSVVLKDVPDGVVVAGVPAQCLRKNG